MLRGNRFSTLFGVVALVVAGLTAAFFAASGNAAKPRKPGYTYPPALTASDLRRRLGRTGLTTAVTITISVIRR